MPAGLLQPSQSVVSTRYLALLCSPFVVLGLLVLALLLLLFPVRRRRGLHCQVSWLSETVVSMEDSDGILKLIGKVCDLA